MDQTRIKIYKEELYPFYGLSDDCSFGWDEREVAVSSDEARWIKEAFFEFRKVQDFLKKKFPSS